MMQHVLHPPSTTVPSSTPAPALSTGGPDRRRRRSFRGAGKAARKKDQTSSAASSVPSIPEDASDSRTTTRNYQFLAFHQQADSNPPPAATVVTAGGYTSAGESGGDYTYASTEPSGSVPTSPNPGPIAIPNSHVISPKKSSGLLAIGKRAVKEVLGGKGNNSQTVEGKVTYYGRGGAGRNPKQLPTISANSFTGTRKEPSIGLHTPESSNRSSSAYSSSIATSSSHQHAIRRSSTASLPYAPSIEGNTSGCAQSSVASSSYAPSIAEGGSGYAPSVTSSAYAPSIHSQPHSYSRRLTADRSHRSVSPGQSISRKTSFTGVNDFDSPLAGWNGGNDQDLAQETATYLDQGPMLENGIVDVGYLSSSPNLRHQKSQPHFIDSLSNDGSGSEANYSHRTNSHRGALADQGVGAGTHHVTRRLHGHGASRGHHTPNPPYPHPQHRPHPLHHVSSFENYQTETNSDYGHPAVIHEEATPVAMFASGTPEESPRPHYPYTPDPSVSPYPRSPSAPLRHQQSQGYLSSSSVGSVRHGTPAHLSLGQAQLDHTSPLSTPLPIPPNGMHSPPVEMLDLGARAAQMQALIEQQAQAQAQAAISSLLLSNQQQQSAYGEHMSNVNGASLEPSLYNASSVLNSAVPSVTMNDSSIQALYTLLASAGISVPPNLFTPSSMQLSVPTISNNPLINSLAGMGGLDLSSALGQLSLMSGLGGTAMSPPSDMEVNAAECFNHSQSHSPESQGVASPYSNPPEHLVAPNAGMNGEEETEVEIPPPPYSQHHKAPQHHSSQSQQLYNTRNFAPTQSLHQPSSSPPSQQSFSHVQDHQQLPVTPSPPSTARSLTNSFGIVQQLEGGGADVSMYHQPQQQYQQPLSAGLQAPPLYGMAMPLSSTQGF